MQLAQALIDAHTDKRILSQQNTQSRLLARATSSFGFRSAWTLTWRQVQAWARGRRPGGRMLSATGAMESSMASLDSSVRWNFRPRELGDRAILSVLNRNGEMLFRHLLTVADCDFFLLERTSGEV